MPPKASGAARKGAAINAGIGINLPDTVAPFAANTTESLTGPTVEQEQMGTTAALKNELSDHISTLKAAAASNSLHTGTDFYASVSGFGGNTSSFLDSATEQHNQQIASLVAMLTEDPAAVASIAASSNVHSAHPLFHNTTNLTFNFLAKPVRSLVEHHNKNVTLRQQRMHLEPAHAMANCIRVRVDCAVDESTKGQQVGHSGHQPNGANTLLMPLGGVGSAVQTQKKTITFEGGLKSPPNSKSKELEEYASHSAEHQHQQSKPSLVSSVSATRYILTGSSAGCVVQSVIGTDDSNALSGKADTTINTSLTFIPSRSQSPTRMGSNGTAGETSAGNAQPLLQSNKALLFVDTVHGKMSSAAPLIPEGIASPNDLAAPQSSSVSIPAQTAAINLRSLNLIDAADVQAADTAELLSSQLVDALMYPPSAPAPPLAVSLLATSLSKLGHTHQTAPANFIPSAALTPTAAAAAASNLAEASTRLTSAKGILHLSHAQQSLAHHGNSLALLRQLEGHTYHHSSTDQPSIRLTASDHSRRFTMFLATGSFGKPKSNVASGSHQQHTISSNATGANAQHHAQHEQLFVIGLLDGEEELVGINPQRNDSAIEAEAKVAAVASLESQPRPLTSLLPRSNPYRQVLNGIAPSRCLQRFADGPDSDEEEQRPETALGGTITSRLGTAPRSPSPPSRTGVQSSPIPPRPKIKKHVANDVNFLSIAVGSSHCLVCVQDKTNGHTYVYGRGHMGAGALGPRQPMGAAQKAVASGSGPAKTALASPLARIAHKGLPDTDKNKTEMGSPNAEKLVSSVIKERTKLFFRLGAEVAAARASDNFLKPGTQSEVTHARSADESCWEASTMAFGPIACLCERGIHSVYASGDLTIAVSTEAVYGLGTLQEAFFGDLTPLLPLRPEDTIVGVCIGNDKAYVLLEGNRLYCLDGSAPTSTQRFAFVDVTRKVLGAILSASAGADDSDALTQNMTLVGADMDPRDPYGIVSSGGGRGQSLPGASLSPRDGSMYGSYNAMPQSRLSGRGAGSGLGDDGSNYEDTEPSDDDSEDQTEGESNTGGPTTPQSLAGAALPSRAVRAGTNAPGDTAPFTVTGGASPPANGAAFASTAVKLSSFAATTHVLGAKARRVDGSNPERQHSHTANNATMSSFGSAEGPMGGATCVNPPLPIQLHSIKGGRDHWVVQDHLTSRLFAWGSNSFGQLGDKAAILAKWTGDKNQSLGSSGLESSNVYSDVAKPLAVDIFAAVESIQNRLAETTIADIYTIAAAAAPLLSLTDVNAVSDTRASSRGGGARSTAQTPDLFNLRQYTASATLVKKGTALSSGNVSPQLLHAASLAPLPPSLPCLPVAGYAKRLPMQAPLQLAKASAKQPPTNPIHSFIQNLVAVAPILLTPPPLPPQQLNNKQNVANGKAPAKNLSNKAATTSQSESPSLLVPRPLTTVAEVALHMADNPTFRGIHLGTGLALSAADIIGIPTSVMITSFVCLGWCTIVEVSALVTDVTHLLIEGFRRKVMDELEIRDAAARQRLLTGSDHNSAGGSAGNKGGKGTTTNKVMPAAAPPPPPKAPTATKTSGPSYLRKVAPTHVEPPPAEIVPLDTVPPIIRRVSILVMLGQTSSSGR